MPGAPLPRVLLIEPVPGRARALRERLTDGGYEVASALDGESALAAVRRVNPRVIVLAPGKVKRSGCPRCGRSATTRWRGPCRWC